MEYPEFNGKTAIATGAASGMALLFLQKMAEQGANVVLTDVNEDAVQAAAGEIRRKGGARSASRSMCGSMRRFRMPRISQWRSSAGLII